MSCENVKGLKYLALIPGKIKQVYIKYYTK